MSKNQLNDTAPAQKNSKHRIEKWDLLRSLLIFLVVLGHLVEQPNTSKNMRALFLFIYTFHMPCFFFLNGLLGKRNIQERRYDCIFSYFVLFLFATILNNIVKGFINHSIRFSLFTDSSLQWYALCLFWFNLLTIFLGRFSKKWVLISAVILACMAGYDSNIGDTLAISRTIVYFPFYFAGYCLDPKQIAKKLSSPMIRVGSALFLIALAAVCLFKTDAVYFFRPLITGRNPYIVLSTVYGMDNLVVYGGLLRLLYYIIAATGCISVISLIPNHLPHSNAIQAVGKRSLEVYLLHRPLIYILYDGFSISSYFTKWGISYWIVLPLALVITAFCALPFWEKPIRAIIYPRIISQDHKVNQNDE